MHPVMALISFNLLCHTHRRAESFSHMIALRHKMPIFAMAAWGTAIWVRRGRDMMQWPRSAVMWLQSCARAGVLRSRHESINQSIYTSTNSNDIYFINHCGRIVASCHACHVASHAPRTGRTRCSGTWSARASTAPGCASLWRDTRTSWAPSPRTCSEWPRGGVVLWWRCSYGMENGGDHAS